MTEKENNLCLLFAACKQSGCGLVSALSKANELYGLGEAELAVIADKTGLNPMQLKSIASFYTAISGEEGEDISAFQTYPEAQTGETRLVLRKYSDIDDYIRSGGFQALEKAISSPRETLELITSSGVSGRGGAGFLAGNKWRFTYASRARKKYVVLNCAEGEPGTGKDHALLLANPYAVLDGLSICAAVVGADNGYIYVREGYSDVREALQHAVQEAVRRGLLGPNICGTGKSFQVEILVGAGGYTCGEETGLLEFIEGKRAEPRIKPPYPGICGLLDAPTVINNAETFANVALALRLGAEAYSQIGKNQSVGTRLFTVSGCVKNSGVYEFPYGVTPRQIFQAAGGAAGGKALKGIQLGGNASGAILGLDCMDLSLDEATVRAAGYSLGTGAIRFIDSGESVIDTCLAAYRFLHRESCGNCVPCRVGLGNLIDMLSGKVHISSLDELRWEAEYIGKNALCGLGQVTPTPLLSALKNFGGEFEQWAEGLGV